MIFKVPSNPDHCMVLWVLSEMPPVSNYYLSLGNGLPVSMENFNTWVTMSVDLHLDVGNAACWLTVFVNGTRLVESRHLFGTLLSYWFPFELSTHPYFLIFPLTRDTNSYGNTFLTVLFLSGIHIALEFEVGRQMDDFRKTFKVKLCT